MRWRKGTLLRPTRGYTHALSRRRNTTARSAIRRTARPLREVRGKFTDTVTLTGGSRAIVASRRSSASPAQRARNPGVSRELVNAMRPHLGLVGLGSVTCLLIFRDMPDP